MSTLAPVPGLPDVAANAAQWRTAVRSMLAGAAGQDCEQASRERDIDELLHERAARVDGVVRSAWERCLGSASAATLVATGGYGRRELFPHSDVDLLILAEAGAQEHEKGAIAEFIALLWDAGLDPGTAVRSIAQCITLAADDITVATALTESRHLAGRRGAYDELVQASIAPDLWPPKAYLDAKRGEQLQRHRRYNDTAYNLEPNLKDGPGGLRDVHTLIWIGMRVHGARSLQALAELGAIGADELATLERERRALSRLRFGLHCVAGRREERLLFDYQTALAQYLGHDDGDGNLAVERMMQGFFRSAAMVLRLNARLLQRFEENLGGDAEVVAIDAGFEMRGDYLALRDRGAFEREPLSMLRLFTVWQAHPGARGLHSSTARALGEALDRIDDALRADERAHELFMAILRGERAVETLARMAGLGVLGRYLPEFGGVSGRMQYDLFHVYTVDQHTLTVLRNIASFEHPQSQDRFALAHEIWPRLRKPELLLLAALFHDIAKGRGGDHSELGAADARAFCSTHGLSGADTDLVCWLVRHHLAMSVTAQRQDISDPEVVQHFAELVGERERLDYLYLLTVADIAGTSPKLWNAWKDRLLADLYTSTRFVLRQGLEVRAYADERIAETAANARALLREAGLQDAQVDALWAEFPAESFLRYRAEQVAWQTRGIAGHGTRDRPLVLARPHARPGALEVFVYSPDRDGLFATVAATLDRLGLSVVEARVVSSRQGMSMDTFQVLDAGTEFVAPERRAATVTRALEQVLSVTPYRAEPVQRAVPRQLQHFRVPARIEFDPEPVPGRTEMTVICADRPGLLARLAAVLRAHQVRVHDARIATFGERVEDFFLLSDAHNRALTDETRDSLRAALVECIEAAYRR
ncbi:MAG TPA: [protein-PII] uridylyltransferase [Xanthomonadaceae bacterium]|nr:[protein-PII] uridylyltransferase [Xanthomonadaceae bacterium]